MLLRVSPPSGENKAFVALTTALGVRGGSLAFNRSLKPISLNRSLLALPSRHPQSWEPMCTSGWIITFLRVARASGVFRVSAV